MRVSARWILPIDQPPIAGGWVELSEERIVAFGAGRPPGPAEDWGDVAIMPGLVNAHTHLELSWMAGRVPPAESMVEWLTELVTLRRGESQVGSQVVEQAVVEAVDALRAAGTVLVGDVSNTLVSVPALRQMRFPGVVFHELLGFRSQDPESAARTARARLTAGSELTASAAHDALRGRVVAHAPYSVSPALLREIAAMPSEIPLAIHLGESKEELELLHTGTGPMREFLEALGVWDDAWTVPRCGPVEYLERVGYLAPGLLAVHATHLDGEALDRLARAGAYVVACPRSNIWVGVGPPRVARLYASGVPVALGTDSLASVATLSLFDELAELRRLAPEVTAASLLESATRIGAMALGFGDSYGTIAPGKRAALIAVDVPSGVRDVEEYLVGGVPTAAIRHLS